MMPTSEHTLVQSDETDTKPLCSSKEAFIVQSLKKMSIALSDKNIFVNLQNKQERHHSILLPLKKSNKSSKNTTYENKASHQRESDFHNDSPPFLSGLHSRESTNRVRSLVFIHGHHVLHHLYYPLQGRTNLRWSHDHEPVERKPCGEFWHPAPMELYNFDNHSTAVLCMHRQ